jgi:hypothetical protein
LKYDPKREKKTGYSHGPSQKYIRTIWDPKTEMANVAIEEVFSCPRLQDSRAPGISKGIMIGNDDQPWDS